MPLTRAHDVAEQKEVDVAVDESLAGRGRRHFLAGELDRRVVALPRIGQIDVGPETRDVRQQMPDRDARPCRSARSPGMNVRDRIVQTDPALLDQPHHRGRRRHHLGQRGEVEDRVERHRLGRRDRRRAGRRPSRRRPSSPRPTSTTAPALWLRLRAAIGVSMHERIDPAAQTRAAIEAVGALPD